MCWLGNIPVNLKTSKSFLLKNIIFYLCAGLFIQANIADLGEAFLQIFIELFIMVLFVTALFKLNSSLVQFEQIFTALVVCENVFYLFALPIAIWYIAIRTSEYSLLPIYAGIVLIVWFCAMVSHLLHQLFDFRIMVSISLSVFYFVVTYFGSFALLFM